jgi:hypothetical protein
MKMRAMTVSGTTVTIGAESATTGASAIWITGVSSTVFLTFSFTTSSTLYFKPYSISGTTISAGTEASVASANIVNGADIFNISSGARWAALYRNNAGTGMDVSICSVSGTTATLSTVTVGTTSSERVSTAGVVVSGSKLIYIADDVCNIVTDTAGTASAGTAISVGTNTAGGYVTCVGGFVSGTKAYFVGKTTIVSYGICIDFSGSSPTLVSTDYFIGLPFPIQSRLNPSNGDPSSLGTGRITTALVSSKFMIASLPVSTTVVPCVGLITAGSVKLYKNNIFNATGFQKSFSANSTTIWASGTVSAVQSMYQLVETIT